MENESPLNQAALWHGRLMSNAYQQREEPNPMRHMVFCCFFWGVGSCQMACCCRAMDHTIFVALSLYEAKRPEYEYKGKRRADEWKC